MLFSHHCALLTLQHIFCKWPLGSLSFNNIMGCGHFSVLGDLYLFLWHPLSSQDLWVIGIFVIWRCSKEFWVLFEGLKACTTCSQRVIFELLCLFMCNVILQLSFVWGKIKIWPPNHIFLSCEEEALQQSPLIYQATESVETTVWHFAQITKDLWRRV